MTPGWHTDLIFRIDQEQDSLIDSLQQVERAKLNQMFCCESPWTLDKGRFKS